MSVLREGRGATATAAPSDAFVTVELMAHDAAPAARIAARLGSQDLCHLLVFACPQTDLTDLVTGLAEAMPDLPVTACTTAGEIGATGYVEGRILVIGLPSRHFATASVVVEDLCDLDAAAVARRTLAARLALAADFPAKRHAFSFLMVDGLSLREDELVAALAPGLGGMPIFGGSAGDGARFERTLVAHGGRVMRDAAVLTLAVTDYRVQVFSLNHLRPTDRKMVVTAADPKNRIVKEINAAPAGREYARVFGEDPETLDEFTFAAHPVVVQLGDRHHVRAIRRMDADGNLVFFSAIDEGMVLTVAESDDMADHLDRTLTRLCAIGRPAGILGCDCTLRRAEAEQTGQAAAMSRVLSDHGVRGFSTYGEQIGPMHLNHTMTGVILFDPEDRAAP